LRKVVAAVVVNSRAHRPELALLFQFSMTVQALAMTASSSPCSSAQVTFSS